MSRCCCCWHCTNRNGTVLFGGESIARRAPLVSHSFVFPNNLEAIPLTRSLFYLMMFNLFFCVIGKGCGVWSHTSREKESGRVRLLSKSTSIIKSIKNSPLPNAIPSHPYLMFGLVVTFHASYFTLLHIHPPIPHNPTLQFNRKENDKT